MMIDKAELIVRKKELQRLLSRIKAKYKDLPEETIYVARRKDNIYYYYRGSDKLSRPHYIKQSNVKLIKTLMQKSYVIELRKTIEKELKAIESFLAHFPEVSPEELYDRLNKERQQFVIPELESDKLFMRHWEEEKYESLREAEKLGVVTRSSAAVYDGEDGDSIPVSENITDRGEIVRSKSECLIANMLNKNGIPYKYEKPLWLGGTQIYPDFTILDVRNRREIYLEHFGRLDDEDYLERNIRKLNRYASEGYYLGDRLLVTMETRAQPLNLPAAEKMVLLALARTEAA